VVLFMLVCKLVGQDSASVNPIPDNDDDGETAAGNRLAHLLQILVCRNPNSESTLKQNAGFEQCPRGGNSILRRHPPRPRSVQVSFYSMLDGLELRTLRHINQAARDALEVGGFLDDQDTRSDLGPRDKKRLQVRNRSRK
jgi:hypothetical protein